jgi:hypothetical protein
MTLTRNGIIRELRLSPYQYRSGSLTFYFSSQLHLRRFNDRIKGHQQTIAESLTRRFKFRVDADRLAEVHLYMDVESRGFFITRETPAGLETLCHPNDLKLSGGTVMKKN